MAYTNTEKATDRYEMYYDKHISFELRFSADDDVFVECLKPIAFAADSSSFRRYSKLLSRGKRYLAISAGPKYAKIEQDGFWITESINRLTRVAKKRRQKMEVTSDSSPDTNTDPL